MNAPNPEVQRFLDLMEWSQTDAAEGFEVSQPTVSEWLRGVRPVPHATAAEMEKLTDGQVLAERVRPDERWLRIPDRRWPTKAGRPVLDVTKAAA